MPLLGTLRDEKAGGMSTEVQFPRPGRNRYVDPRWPSTLVPVDANEASALKAIKNEARESDKFLRLLSQFVPSAPKVQPSEEPRGRNADERREECRKKAAHCELYKTP